MAFVALGTVASGWALRYTDWFPEIGGLLALGGIFSWLAFVFRIAPSETTEGLQKWFAAVMGSWKFLAILSTLAVVGVYEADRHASIRVEASRASAVRDMWVFAAGEGHGKLERLDADGQRKIVLPVTRAHAGSFWVKLPGLPGDLLDGILPWSRTSRYYPDDFHRTVVLVAPSADLADAHYTNSPDLELSIDGARKFRIPLYRWFSFWVGCSQGTEYPQRVRQELEKLPDTGSGKDWKTALLYPRSEAVWYSKQADDWPVTEYDISGKKIEISLTGLKTCLNKELESPDYVEMEILSACK